MTGRGGNGSIGVIRDKVRARGNGDGLATSRVARPIDRLQTGAIRPTWYIVCRAEKMQLPVRNAESPPTSDMEVSFEPRPRPT